MQSQVRDFIQQETQMYDVVIYSKSYCPFCLKTKKFFKSIPNVNVQVRELDLVSNGDDIQGELLNMTGQRTVPNVFVRGEHVGGNDDVYWHSKEIQQQLQLPAKADTTESFVANEIQNHSVVIFSKTYCPYCAQTKQYFRSQMPHVDVKIHELDTMPNGSDIQKELARVTGQSSVPSVFVKGQHLGGNDDTQEAARSGVLAQQLVAN